MKYKCTACGYIYDDNVEAVKFEDLPDSDIEYYFLEWYFTEDDDEEASEDIPSSEPLNIPVPIAAKTTIKTTINATKPTIIIFLLFSSSPADAGT